MCCNLATYVAGNSVRVDANRRNTKSRPIINRSFNNTGRYVQQFTIDTHRPIPACVFFYLSFFITPVLALTSIKLLFFKTFVAILVPTTQGIPNSLAIIAA